MSQTAKKAIRREMLAARARLSLEKRRQKSNAIGRRLCELAEYRDSHTVLFFVGFGTEVSTLPMITHALEGGKTVVAPRVRQESGDLELRQVQNPQEELSEGAMGILEPKSGSPEVPLRQIDLIVVPAVAWDTDGYRVGYGGGFYDRLLGHNENAVTVGLGFECQLIDRVPRAPHDLGVDVLVTEDRVLRFNQG